MSKCRYYKKMRKKGYNRCIRDNSIRKGCGWSCPFYKPSIFSEEWFAEKLTDFTYWLEGVFSGRR